MPIPKVIVLATHNSKKIKELQDIIAHDCQIKDLSSFPTQWEETGQTFAQNALIKAEAVAKMTDLPILADDSGLEVAALQGAPGVYSSRYAGEDGNDRANNHRLLDELRGQQNRQARFVCCLCYLDETRQAHFFEGSCEGHIGHEAQGKLGFGYDPLFYPKGSNRSLGEYSAAEKNQMSHRHHAIKEWLAFIKD